MNHKYAQSQNTAFDKGKKHLTLDGEMELFFIKKLHYSNYRLFKEQGIPRFSAKAKNAVNGKKTGKKGQSRSEVR